MIHYRKGPNVENEIKKEDLPFDECIMKQHKDFLWMQVKGGTKVNNVISHVQNALDKAECRSVVWSGAGGGVVKTVSCAEILKRSYPLYQLTRMCYTTVEEHWEPQMEGLEEIVANRQIPSIHILMSLDVIEDHNNEVQIPNTQTEFWSNTQPSEGNSSNKPKQRSQLEGEKNQRKFKGKRKPPRSSENEPKPSSSKAPHDHSHQRQQE